MKDVNPQARPSKNPNIPHPGRKFYDGQWRTPEQVTRRQEQHREKMRKRRQDPQYVARENSQARDRMRRLYKPVVRAAIRWRPKPEDLKAAAGTDEELMELVLAQLRDEYTRQVRGSSGLVCYSLDAPAFTEGDLGSWHEVHGDPNHWREPGRLEA